MEFKPKFSSFYFYFFFSAFLLFLIWIFPLSYVLMKNRIDLILYSPFFWIVFLVDIILSIIPFVDYLFRKYEIEGGYLYSNGLWGKFKLNLDDVKDVDVVETLPDIIFSTKSIKINERMWIHSIKKAHDVVREIVGG